MSRGLARGSRSNPVASLRILSIYATPVLMSGLASLVLSPKEIGSVDQQYKRTLQNITKLSTNTTASVISFVTGSLPATAILHLKQLTLFGMITRMENDPLNIHARHVLLTGGVTSPKSSFLQVRNLLLQYRLPHPRSLLEHPP